MAIKASNHEPPRLTDLPGGPWRVLPQESDVAFRVRKMGLYFVKGRFAGVEGRIDFGHEGLPRGGQVTIDATSVSTRMPPRDWHLRTPDFLAVKRHPRIEVAADLVEPLTDGTLRVLARFTVRGSQHQAPLDGHLHRAGDDALIVHLRGVVDRRDLGLRPRAPFAWIVGRDVHLDVRLHLVRATDSVAAGG